MTCLAAVHLARAWPDLTLKIAVDMFTEDIWEAVLFHVVYNEHEHQEETMRVCEVGRLIQVLSLFLPRLPLRTASACLY